MTKAQMIAAMKAVVESSKIDAENGMGTHTLTAKRRRIRKCWPCWTFTLTHMHRPKLR